MPKKNAIVVLLAGIFSTLLIFSSALAQSPSATGVAKAPDAKIKKEKTDPAKLNAESHRRVVSGFVESLLAVANRERGVGEQMKEIAKSQNDSKERMARSIESIQGRSKWKTFFFGSDYKNLGQLRSEMVKTRNDINQLIRIIKLTGNPEMTEDKAELGRQIVELQTEQIKIQNFIDADKNELGVIGWVTRVFR